MCGDFRRLDRVAVLARLRDERLERLNQELRWIIEVEKYMKGEMPRLNTVGNKLGYDNVIEFLNAMADFDRRMRNVSKLIKAMRNQESSVVTESTSPKEPTT